MRSRKRAMLLRQQDYRCALCGVMFDPDEVITFVEVHHDTPRHCGGTDRISNLKLVHRWCHKAHNARTMGQAAEA
ncbi:HNH endonuclease [Methylobacterium tarhaniae]|uniref:HNH endonuclease n=1 Tax=Methylobacterium tarhaniae TaxID=1187852 RepID=UPI003D04894B